MDDLVKNFKNFKILTDTGWENFDGIINKGFKKTLLIKTTTSQIQCTADHMIYVSSLQKKRAASFKPGDTIYGLFGIQKVVSIELKKIEEVYDILNSGSKHRFYANDLLISNCEFIIDEETLINSIKLSQLESKEPVYKTGQVRWFKRPEKNKIYVLGLDPSLGTGGDAAAIQVFEADTTCQVAEWRHNRTTIPEQIKLLADICKQIVDITGQPDKLYYSLENNNIGEAALISLAEYGEENIQGTMISEPKVVGSSRRYRRGFNTTNKTKLAACAKFKILLESGKLSIYSSTLISELKTFVASGGSYAAKVGETDDLVMAALLVVRIFQHLQNYHVELDNHIRDHSEVIEPMPFIMTTLGSPISTY